MMVLCMYVRVEGIIIVCILRLLDVEIDKQVYIINGQQILPSSTANQPPRACQAHTHSTPTYVIARLSGGVCAFHTKKDNLNISRSHLAFKYGGYVFLVLIAVSDRKLRIHSKR